MPSKRLTLILTKGLITEPRPSPSSGNFCSGGKLGKRTTPVGAVEYPRRVMKARSQWPGFSRTKINDPTLYVMARCALTQRSYSTGVVMDRKSFASLHSSARKIRCPLCAAIHEWSPGEVWLETEAPAETSIPWLLLNNRGLPND